MNCTEFNRNLKNFTYFSYFRVDHTDVFGRSRQITRKELRKIKKQDEELEEIVESRDQQQAIKRDSSSSRSSGELSNESEGEMIGPDIGLAFLEQKKQWEKQEDLNKERSSLHYQDILFDEARQHGVGFYEFSTDHDEREKQQEALNKIRDETLKKQQERENLKKTRDSVIANRVKAAKARVRGLLKFTLFFSIDFIVDLPARLGLPEEVEEEKKGERGNHKTYFRYKTSATSFQMNFTTQPTKRRRKKKPLRKRKPNEKR
jgi:hypothetical protein